MRFIKTLNVLALSGSNHKAHDCLHCASLWVFIVLYKQEVG